MKKNNNNLKFVLVFLLGLIVSFAGTTFAASQILASNVDFTPRDSSWSVDNAQAAINDLYYKVPGVPTGTILPFMGTTAPTGYLICDGSTYNISSHSNLANFIKDQFGSYNYFGGDGTTTFKVPDLRGEFLRGTGTASRNTGSGLAVGTHQDPTKHLNLYRDNNISVIGNTNGGYGILNGDTFSINVAGGSRYVGTSPYSTSGTTYVYYTSRPTNTSVLYIIKY